MALNPTFASASVNPSQSIGSDASAPQQGALPTANAMTGLSSNDTLPGQQFNSLSNDQKAQQYQSQLQQYQPSPLAPTNAIPGMTPNYQGGSLMSNVPNLMQQEITSLGQANQPQYTMWRNEPSPLDTSQNEYDRYTGRLAMTGGAVMPYQDWENNQMNQFGGGQPLTPAQQEMQRENSIRQWENTPFDQRPIWQQPSEATEYPQGNMPQMPLSNMPLMRNNFGGAGVNFNIPNGQPQPTPQVGNLGNDVEIPKLNYLGYKPGWQQEADNTWSYNTENFTSQNNNDWGENYLGYRCVPNDAYQKYQDALSRGEAGDFSGDVMNQYTATTKPRYTTDFSQLGLSQTALDQINMNRQAPDLGQYYYDTKTGMFNQGAGRPGPNTPGQRRYTGMTNIPLDVMNRMGTGEQIDFSPYKQYSDNSYNPTPPQIGDQPLPEQQPLYDRTTLRDIARLQEPMPVQQPEQTLNPMDDDSNYINGMYSPKGVSWMSNPEYASLGGDMMMTIYKQPDGTYLDDSGKPTDYSKYNQRIDWTQNRFNPTPPTQQPGPTPPPLAPQQQDYTNPSDFEGLTFAETNNFNDMPMFHYDQDATREQKLRNEAPYMTRQNYINNLNNIRRPVDESGFGSTGRITQPVQQPQVLNGVTGTPTSPLTPTAPTGTTPMATNPLSTYATTPTTGSTPAPNLNVTPGASSSGNFGQGGVLPNVTTTQQQVTAAPSFYTDYLNQLATQGGQAAQNAQYVGAQPLQEQAFNLASQNVGNYQPTLQNAINLASSVGNTNLAQAIGDVGQANIARNLAPQATAGIVGSGQFGSKRGAQALGDVIANAELGLTAQQQQAMQQDMANRIAAAQQLGTLANSTQALGLGDVNALSTLGQQQQTIAQNQQLFPMQQLANQSALLRGYTIPTSVSASQTGPGQQGQFQTSPLQQIMSVGTLLGALAKPSADYIDPKTGLLVKGTSAGGNFLGGIDSLLKRLTGGTYTANPSSNTTTSTSVGDTSASMKTLPDGRPNPNYDAYADANATDEDRMAQNLLNGGFDRSNPTSYDEIGSGGYPSNIDEN